MDVEQTSRPVRPMAVQLGDLVRALSGVEDLTTDYASVAATLQELLGVSASSVVDTRSGRSVVLVASPPEMAKLEEDTDDSSPSMNAGATNAVDHRDDLAAAAGADAAYAEAAEALDIRAVVALPLVARGTAFGALCLYSGSSRVWSEEDLAIGTLLADLVAGHLGNTAALRDQMTLTGQLQTALDSRVLIEQAKGVLAASEKIGVGEAFTRLRDTARRTNRKLETVAAEVIAAGTARR